MKESKIERLLKSDTFAGLMFVGPMLAGVFVLVLIPILATLVLGFADWNFVQGWDGISWVGLDNFQKLTEEPMFKKSFMNNMIFLLAVPIYMLISMVLAILIDRYVYLKGVFQGSLFHA